MNFWDEAFLVSFFNKKVVEWYKTCFLGDLKEKWWGPQGIREWCYSSRNRGVKKWLGPRGMWSSGFPVASLHMDNGLKRFLVSQNSFKQNSIIKNRCFKYYPLNFPKPWAWNLSLADIHFQPRRWSFVSTKYRLSNCWNICIWFLRVWTVRFLRYEKVPFWKRTVLTNNFRLLRLSQKLLNFKT